MGKTSYWILFMSQHVSLSFCKINTVLDYLWFLLFFFLGSPLLRPFITRKVYTSVSNWKSVTLDMKTFKLIFITWRREQNFLKGSFDSSLNPMHETQERYIDSFLLAWVAIVSVGLESKERPRNGIFGTCFAYAKNGANPMETLATQASFLWAKR